MVHRLLNSKAEYKEMTTDMLEETCLVSYEWIIGIKCADSGLWERGKGTSI